MNRKFSLVMHCARGAVLCAWGLTAVTAAADDNASAEKHVLRYKFQPGQTLRWNVEHLKNVRTTVQGTTQTAEMITRSIKVWKVVDVTPDGQAKLENSVESVDLVQKQSGRAEVRYDSQNDESPPAGYEQFAESIGQTLSEITLDSQGKVVKREARWPGATTTQAQVTVPLPDEPASAGHSWHLPDEVSVKLKSGEVRKIQTRQRFTLESVADGVAEIAVETQLLTPTQDPEVLVQLIDLKTKGRVRFDIEQGRVIDQQLDSDEDVIGFSGQGSHMRSTSRFNEKWLPAAAQTAARPAAKSEQ